MSDSLRADKQDVGVYIGGNLLPITPAEIKIKTPTEKNTHNILEVGEIDILHGKKIEQISIKGILPYGAPYYANDESEPSTWVNMFNSLVENSIPFLFVYVGIAWDINLQGSMHDLEMNEKGGSLDVEYSFSVRRYVDVKAIQLEHKTPKEERSAQKSKVKNTNKSQTYTVKKNDTLSHIAKGMLGSASRWGEVYSMNSDIVKNPNLIYPGQILKLPDDASGTVPQRSSMTATQI